MRIPRSLLAATATLVAVVATPGIAAAHIDPTPTEVPAGSTATVAFGVEHGCEGSPTVKLEIKVPETITAVAPTGKEGWTGSLDMHNVLTYSDGSLPDDEEGSFGITFTVPSTVGEELRFPIIQTCEEGSIEWIQTSEEDEHPAPVVTIGEPDPNATTSTTDGTGTTTGSAAASSTTEAEATTSTVATTLGSATSTEEQTDEDKAVSPALWILGGVIVVAGVGGGIWLAMRRGDRSGQAGDGA